jgi:hypothetical protein
MSNSKISVIDLRTEKHEWRQKLETFLAARQQVVLIGMTETERDGNDLASLLQKHGYATPAVPTGAEWQTLQKDLNLAGLAGKEQAIDRTTVHLLKP